MIPELIPAFRWVASPLQFGNLFGNEGPIESVLDVVTGGFSFLLFVITLYAWSRRGRQPTLLIVSFGFLTFFVKQVIEILPLSSLNGELFQLCDGLSNFDSILLCPSSSTKEKCKTKRINPKSGVTKGKNGSLKIKLARNAGSGAHNFYRKDVSITIHVQLNRG